MSQAIRIALVSVAVVAVIALLMPVLTQIGSGLTAVAQSLPGLISTLSSYLMMGRTFLNALIGFPVVVDLCLWLVLIAPLSLHVVKFAIYIYSKLVG